MKFSICIPNYNYEKYIGRTIQSVLDQTYQDFEILVSDNASTDRSVEIVRGFKDPRIKLNINSCNIGFAANLDRAGGMATGDLMIMLSSDDLMRKEALKSYYEFYKSLGDDTDRAVLTSTVEVIDGEDHVTGKTGPDSELWLSDDVVNSSELLRGIRIYQIDGKELLKRCLHTMKNPFNFAATVYPGKIYQRVEGYGSNRLINPDKWFHWKLLAADTVAYFLDIPLFAYRWHESNQSAIQASQGALKYLVDEYISTLEMSEVALQRVGLNRETIEQAFVERDIADHGLATLARGDREKAKRILSFGRAVYPRQVRKNPKTWALSFLLALGYLGRFFAERIYQNFNCTSYKKVK